MMTLTVSIRIWETLRRRLTEQTITDSLFFFFFNPFPLAFNLSFLTRRILSIRQAAPTLFSEFHTMQRAIVLVYGPFIRSRAKFPPNAERSGNQTLFVYKVRFVRIQSGIAENFSSRSKYRGRGLLHGSQIFHRRFSLRHPIAFSLSPVPYFSIFKFSFRPYISFRYINLTDVTAFLNESYNLSLGNSIFF